MFISSSGPQEIGLEGLAFAEELLGLVVEVAAVFVVALAERNDRYDSGGSVMITT